MQATCFTFETRAVRTLGTPELPLFVAVDVATALGYANPKAAPAKLVDPEDLIKAEVETNGGTQLVNCVNESGLYALIFGSKLESAKRFKKWVTSEVLPAIRRTGRYECPVVASQTIDAAQQLAIRNAIAHRAKTTSAHYRTIYNALYDAFQVPRYTELKAADFDDAIRFIEAYALPQLAAPADRITLTREEANAFLSVAYQLKYLFRDPYRKFAAFLNAVGSPMSGQFFDAFNDMAVELMASALERNGLRIEDLDCYRYWAMKH